MNCLECRFYSDIFWKCNKKNIVIKPSEVEKNCNVGIPIATKSELKNKNKGLAIRDNKRQKQNKKMRELKDDQENLCRFVWIEYMLFHRVNGKTRPYKKVGNLGLQISNRVFLNDGTYKWVNNKNLKIKKVYEDIPCLLYTSPSPRDI